MPHHARHRAHRPRTAAAPTRSVVALTSAGAVVLVAALAGPALAATTAPTAATATSSPTTTPTGAATTGAAACIVPTGTASTSVPSSAASGAEPSGTPTTTPTTSGDAARTSPSATATHGPASDTTRDAGTGTWLSGASGTDAADGTLGAWRGRPLDIVGTWADQGDAQTRLWSVAPGGELADWTGAIDIAPGGLQPGETWSQAAAGAYDDRWRASLALLAQLRAGRGTTYVRPFHEFNLAGWDWSVTPEQAGDFRTAWARYRALQREVFPDAQLVYGVNVTSSGTDLDWRTTWPGAEQADVLGVDAYNGWPTITTEQEFTDHLDDRGAGGVPVGLDAYAAQARAWGVPLAVPEWSGRAEMGDEPAFVEGMTSWFAEHAGTGAGQLAYEVLFNAPQDGGDFQLFGGGRMPESADAYVQATKQQEAGAQQQPTSASASTSPPTGRPTGEEEETSPTATTPTAAPSATPTADSNGQDLTQTRAAIDDLVQRLNALSDQLERG